MIINARSAPFDKYKKLVSYDGNRWRSLSPASMIQTKCILLMWVN